MRTISQILTDLGLTANEAHVFISALKIGMAPVSRLAQESGIGRTYTYEIAQQLKRKGLFAEIEERGIKKVQALDHAGLLAYIERRQRDMAALEKDLVRVASEFRSLRRGIPIQPKVRFFEGVEGIRSINAEIRKDLEKREGPYEFHVIFSADRMEAVLPGWVESNHHIYYEPYMKKYAIISQSPLLKKFLSQVKANHQKNFAYKLWPKDKEEFPTDTLCWLNKIAYLDMHQDHPSGIIIENRAITETFVMWFQQMWSSLK